jgi:uncharacterized membrane protein YeaQ/YmgE (transglycosylase-associated protein family)
VTTISIAICDRAFAHATGFAAAANLALRSRDDRLDERRTMGIIAWIVLGLLAGMIAKAIFPGNDPGGLIVTALIGMAGAVIGGFIAEAVGWEGLESFFEVRTWILAILGSLVLLAIFRAVSGGGSRRATSH